MSYLVIMQRSLLTSLVFILFSTPLLFGQADTASHTWGNWQTWVMRVTEHYYKPVLPGDYSDINCIGVGSDYYAVSSTFQYAPGTLSFYITMPDTSMSTSSTIPIANKRVITKNNLKYLCTQA